MRDVEDINDELDTEEHNLIWDYLDDILGVKPPRQAVEALVVDANEGALSFDLSDKELAAVGYDTAGDILKARAREPTEIGGVVPEGADT